MIGSTVDGKYEVLRLLGQGGMGAVYEVRHAGTNRHLALKVILAAEASRQRSLVVRLQREARAAGAIDSPHILQVVDAGTDPATETPYLVMELLDGEDVQQVQNRVGPLRPDIALRIVAQACIGLGKAHETRVIHRDIKPANLFLARQGRADQANRAVVVKVLDFGIAKLKQEDLGEMESGSLTRTGSVLGSPLYMSPEQARGAKAIDHRADLWSLGVVAYQLMTGRTPYQEIDALGELILAICSELPPCVQDFAPWVDPALAAVVHKALSLEATERYQTADEMFAALVAHLPRGEGGAPDLALREDMLVGPDESARSVSAPRLIAEVGRRPAITGRSYSQHIVTPVPLHLSGSDPGAASSPSPLDLAAGPTVMVPTPVVAVGQSAPGVTASGGTQAGMARSSPAAAEAPAPRRSGTLLAGVAAAAVVIGAGIALLASTVLRDPAMAARPGPDATSSEGPPAVAPPTSAPPTVQAPSALAASALAPPASAPSAAPSASSAPEPTAPVGQGPATPRSSAPVRSSAPPVKPPASATPPAATQSGNSGFGDRK